ncbi:hypothetical protein J4E86_010446 [Alternaria arbusti]|uniref:uncharacterized protein n=1 Tax=Alternaria arbusti TaxID=232088 RepID=UPI00221F542A|nr:uncharacterized protein J4E86_010446 [Alternaria arbusti]KAI4941414.1 hypothetical protein J4E86_010446 [Alternaria arbusti]
MEPDAFVVIVPGTGDPAVEIWSIDGFSDEPLVRDLTKHYMNIQVLVLEHGLPVNGKDFNRWTQVRDSSHAMMQLIYEYREENNTKAMSIPMVFLGHGIGGIFIKDFFWKSSSPELRGFPSQWHQNLVNNTVGVIFLGTPHLTSENIADHENIMGLVTRPPTSRRTKSIDRKLLDLDLQNVYLRLLSEEFDTYIRAHRPDLPVLSIWDGRESKAMQVEEHKLLGRRWKAEKYVIVTYELAKIGLPNEQMMVADCDHYELCTHYNPEFRQRLIAFCQEKLLEAHGRMLGRPGSSSVASTDVLGEGSKVPSPW